MAENNFNKGVEMQNVYLRLKNKLDEAGILAASFELRQILSAVTGDGFYQVRLENEFSNDEIIRIEDMVDRRIAGEPLQYIIGEWEFMGLPLKVREGALIPRPETELLCELGFDFLDARAPGQKRMLDLCCGTGCVGIAAKKYIVGSDVVCLDKYDIPLELTRENAILNEVDITVARGDALSLPPENIGAFDLILTNPPYIPTGDLPSLQTEVRREPCEALDGGEDGLDFYRSIAKNYVPLLKPDGRIYAEIGVNEDEAVAKIFASAGLCEISIANDYAGIPRVVSGAKKG